MFNDIKGIGGDENFYVPNYIVIVTCMFISYFVAYGGLIGLGGLFNPAYVYKYPVTTAGCNITDSDLMANLTSAVYDPATWDPHSHFRFVTL